ncbi:MAG: ORF6N domain-containing protein [Proteobacteria bacterium]|nr:ORF6N domain-containing protein [Pseudomonadota bacterium]
MREKLSAYTTVPIESFITTIRGQKVILDADLAKIYGVPTKRLNEQVKRNADRFPEDFVFQLNAEEAQAWRLLRSQNATLKRGQHLKYLPYAFTEHGAIMAANVLNSPQAVKMSVFVVRAFIRMRQVLSDNRVLAKKLAELEKMLTARLDTHERAIVHVLEQILRLMNPPSRPEPPPKKIGFHIREKKVRYSANRK